MYRHRTVTIDYKNQRKTFNFTSRTKAKFAYKGFKFQLGIIYKEILLYKDGELVQHDKA